MYRYFQSNEYDDLIKKIKRKAKRRIIFTVVAMVIAFIACTPMEIEVMEEKVVDYDGISPIFTVLILILIFIAGLVAYAFAVNPLTTSLDEECDPRKQLALTTAIDKRKNIEVIFAKDLFYIGDFEYALMYANKMIENKNILIKISGLFNKARCEFFKSDFEAFNQTLYQFENEMYKVENNKRFKWILKNRKILRLLKAVAEKDNELIKENYDIEAWNESKATEGFVNFVKGIAAYNIDDKMEAIYRFKYVKENCSKMFIGNLAEEYIEKLESEF